MKDMIIRNRFYAESNPYGVLVATDYYSGKYPGATVKFEFIKNAFKKDKYGKLYNFHIIFNNKDKVRCH